LRANRDGGEKRQELRGGNDARWKTPKTSFPPRLEIWQNTPDFHIPTASTAAYFFFHKTLSGSTSSKFFDGCRSPRSRSIRQRRFAPVVTAIASERVTGINSESVTAFIVISIFFPAPISLVVSPTGRLLGGRPRARRHYSDLGLNVDEFPYDS